MVCPIIWYSVNDARHVGVVFASFADQQGDTVNWIADVAPGIEWITIGVVEEISY